MLHELKILEQYADEVYYNLKTFEIRKNDRHFAVDEKIHFTVIEGGGYVEHPLNYKFYKIKYILEDFEGLKDGYVALAIEPYTPPQQEKIVTTLNGELLDSHWSTNPNQYSFYYPYEITCSTDKKGDTHFNQESTEPDWL